MLINLSDVLSEQHKPIDTEVSLESNEVSLQSGKYSIIEKQPVHIEIIHVKNKELVIKGSSRLVIEIPCDRCLETVAEGMDIEFSKDVDLDATDAGQAECDEMNYIDGFNLDVDQLLYNEILIGWPMKILCCEDCKGICNVCGQNLNEGACDCEDTSLDQRMSVVRDLFKNFKEV